MTTHPFNSNDETTEAEWSDRCVLYLLGELSGLEKIEFERQLAQSPELSEQLLSQAACIDELSMATLSEPAVAAPATSTEFRWIAVATSIALAACLGWLLFSLNGLQGETETLVDAEESETLLIAKVWVDDPAIEADLLVDLDDEDPPTLETEAEIDAPSWMVVALASDTESFVDGEANDG